MHLGVSVKFRKIFFFCIFLFFRNNTDVEINKQEAKDMTSKELLYVEDALGHEQYFQTACKECAAQIQDAQLKTCVEQMAQKHQQIFQSFYSLLG